MKEQVLSIEQMQELQELGIDTSNASIYWSVNKVNARGSKSDLMPPFLTFSKTNLTVGWASFEYIPTFTLQDILGMLPQGSLSFNRNKFIVYMLDSQFNVINEEESESSLEAAFKMLKWCKQNKYI